jgi:hypothetical protein
MADQSIRRIIRYLSWKLKSFFLSKDVLSFLVFLLLSAAFWLVNALDKEREMILKVPLSYSGIPEDVIFEDDMPPMVRVRVRDLGKNLWFYHLNPLSEISLVLKQQFLEKGLISVSNTSIQKIISDRLLPTTAILGIEPESFVGAYVRQHQKKVPVILNTKINTEHQFMLCDQPVFTPDSVIVYGPGAALDTIHSVSTRVLELKQLKESVRSSIELQSIPSLRFSESKVMVEICVVMFTEKSAELTVHIINSPENINLRSFPATVKATFNIRVNHYNEFDVNDIQVVVDYNEIRNSNISRKRLRVINNKPYISNIRIEPEEVEFLLEKNHGQNTNGGPEGSVSEN